MILRKPYAFLIKYFRVIHLVMVACIFYVILKTYNIFNFLESYIASGQIISTYEDISGMYVNTFFIVIVCFLIVLSATILYLMKYKKKPSTFYIFMVTSYFLLLILLLYSSSFIYGLLFETPDLRFTKIIRDLYLLFIAIQIPALIFAFVRTVGFDIKKFDFKKDLLELNISEEDNAEFEVQLGLDTEDIRARIRKKIRFFRYYYKENKVVFLSILICVLLVLTVFLTKTILANERIYDENETFSTRNLNIKVLDSYKTFDDYKGNKINDKYFYVILKLRYTNKSSNNININIDNARLSYTDYNNIAPTTLMYNKFLEFGTPYYSQTLHVNETRDFILVYEVPKEYYNNDLRLKYLYDIQIVNNQADYRYRTVDLLPEEFGNIELIDTKNLKEVLTFDNSILGNTKIVINNIDLSNKYTYNVIRCKSNNCDKYVNTIIPSTNKTHELTLMRINYSLTYDEKLGSEYSISEFIARFGSIRFVINGKEYNSKIDLIDVTPYPTEGYAFLEVREKLNMAEKIYLDFTIRDKKYTYVIKDETNTQEEK